MNSNAKTAKIAKLAMMTAVSLVLLLIVRIPWPPAPFLVYDPADVPIYITAFAFGPLEGLAVTLVVCLIQAFGLGGDGLYGFLMRFVATGIVALIIAVVFSVVSLVQKLMGVALGGFTTVIILQCFTGSVVMISLGIIGYYIAKIYGEVKGRPKYIIAHETDRAGD